MSIKPADPAPFASVDSDPTFPEVEPSSRNAPPPSSAGMRGIIDALLQGSLVELFQAYGVAIAPLPRDARAESQRYPELSAVIGFTNSGTGKNANAVGRLCLSVPPEVVDAMQSDRAIQGRQADWVRELANQLMGRFKNRLLPYGATLQAGLPTSITREVLEAQTAPAGRRLYRARTRRGEVIATLEGSLKESELSYVGHTADATEGELILF